MRFALIFGFFLYAAPVAVYACEQDCMDGVTHAWLGNYTTPILSVLRTLSDEINTRLIPPEKRTSQPLALLQPVIDAYDNQSFSELETAIFPRFFHGKCQQNGVDPPGCPNPDCPVVCGTPGSMVHFYPKLRYITYNQTRHLLEGLVKPGTKTYDQVEQIVLEHSSNARPRMMPRYMRREAFSPVDYSSSAIPFRLQKRSHDVGTTLKEILSSLGSLLEKACGGTGDGRRDELPDCSWEGAMKAFILSYP